MPQIKKYRRIKRPKLTSKGKPLKRPSYSDLAIRYVSIRRNNTSLARALNQQRQENQVLFRENLNLTAQLQDMRLLNERYGEAMALILKNSRSTMEMLVETTSKVVNTITMCNNFQQTEQRASNNRESTRDSIRRTSSVNRSPARGVVQPMVSGHAIAQPAIALSRIRIAVAPNVSRIEETNETGSPSTTVRNSPRAIAPNRRQPALPQRIRLSSPVAQDNSRRSSEDNRRLSNRPTSRYQKRKSRNSTRRSSTLNETTQNSINNSMELTMRSPRVALQDVSRLMNNSQSINLRRLMDSSMEITGRGSEEEEDIIPSSQEEAPTHDFEETSSPDGTSSSSGDNDVNDISQRMSRVRSSRKRQLEKSADETKDIELSQRSSTKSLQLEMSSSRAIPEDDPLEGTSWSYNNSQMVTTDEGSLNDETAMSRDRSAGDESRNSMMMSVRESRGSLRINGGSYGRTVRKSESMSSPTMRMSLTMVKNHWSDADDDDDDDDDGERCQIINMPRKGETDEEPTTNFASLFARNVCTARGRTEELDPDEFTIMQRKKPFKAWTMADLEIPEIAPPVLEQPLVPRNDFIPEPETTKTIQIMRPPPQQIMEQSMTEALPNITVNTSVAMPMLDTAGRESEDETTNIFYQKRNRVEKPIIESSSESSSEVTPPPKKKPVKAKGRTKSVKRKDPSSAKVVLEKIQTPNERKKRASSPDPRRSHSSIMSSKRSATLGNSVNSDSESSNTSVTGTRPRRNKAPTSFAEPSLRKKLRRA